MKKFALTISQVSFSQHALSTTDYNAVGTEKWTRFLNILKCLQSSGVEVMNV